MSSLVANPKLFGEITDYGSNANGSWIKYKNGFMLQTKNINTNATGTLYGSPIYYADVAIGTWQIPFVSINYLSCQVRQPQFWATTSITSSIRLYRAETFGSTAINLIVFAFGTWK